MVLQADVVATKTSRLTCMPVFLKSGKYTGTATWIYLYYDFYNFKRQHTLNHLLQNKCLVYSYCLIFMSLLSLPEQ